MSFGAAGHEPFQHVGEPRHRLDTIQLRGLNQRHGNRPMAGSAVGARKECVFASQRMWADSALHAVRIYLDTTVLEECDQPGPVSYRVAHGLRQI